MRATRESLPFADSKPATINSPYGVVQAQVMSAGMGPIIYGDAREVVLLVPKSSVR